MLINAVKEQNALIAGLLEEIQVEMFSIYFPNNSLINGGLK